MRKVLFGGVIAAAMALAAGAGAAPGEHDGMPAMAHSGMAMAMGRMNMVALAPMPSIYGGEADKPGAPVFKGLGAHRHRISTKSARAQAFFDQGVNLLFGFNHAEAIRSFREAARLDPNCAMCWWGVAFALGPNINMPMPEDANLPAWQALQRAQAQAPKATPIEREWIAALSSRYAENPGADRSALDAAYAKAMGALWKRHPQDLDAGTFYAEAMMDTQPWDYWGQDGLTPKGHAVEIVSTLESIIRRAPNHPGALHLYIHAVEATTTPERAEAASDRLEALMPEAGHIVHMPSHIYYRVGRYADAAKVNEIAARVDEQYIAACKAQGFYPVGYYGHNIHFLWTSAEMDGRYEVAIAAARRLVKAVDAVEVAKGLPQGEIYVFTPVATLLRFGRWDEVLKEPPPPPEERMALAVWLEAQGFAHANKGDLAAARADREKLAELAGRTDWSRYEPMLPAHAVTDLALATLDGEIARTSGNLDDAIGRFRLAAEIEANLPYTEPPWWHQPTSHLLGAALLQAHRASESEAVYRASLKVYRTDGWALEGLAQALAAQGRTAEAAEARQAQTTAWRTADVKLTSSRF